jgi:alpha-N-arabinofuranosidase
MINVLQAMILTDGPRMLLTPTYHIHKMYLPMQDATFVPATFDGGTYVRNGITLPGVDAVAFRDVQGGLWLSLVNLDPNTEKDVVIDLSGISVRSASGEVLTGPNVNSINTFEAAKAVEPRPIAGTVAGGRVSVALPAKSVAMLSLQE